MLSAQLPFASNSIKHTKDILLLSPETTTDKNFGFIIPLLRWDSKAFPISFWVLDFRFSIFLVPNFSLLQRLLVS